MSNESHFVGKYGSFFIKDSVAYWGKEAETIIRLSQNNSRICKMEGLWNPCNHPLKEAYETAVTGLCIWSKYDATFIFKPSSKGNPGAKRSISSPKDREDIMKRLKEGKELDSAVISQDPFGTYQNKIILWQAEIVSRFSIRKLYYSLPIDEYMESLKLMSESMKRK